MTTLIKGKLLLKLTNHRSNIQCTTPVIKGNLLLTMTNHMSMYSVEKLAVVAFMWLNCMLFQPKIS